MDIRIKKATIEEIDNILSNRMDFLYKLTGKEQSDEFKNATREYLNNHINGNSLLCYIAVCNESIVSIVIICNYDVIPKPSNISGKVGYVFNVYTLQEFRGQGLATKLLRCAIDEAKKLGVGELYLSATEQGKAIYEKLQFHHLDKEMCLKIV